MPKYDIVVIGAGNAGLTAALESALAGKKTLLIEQHNLPGGCASSFRRGRFEFEPSLHELGGVNTPEEPGNVRKMFEDYGLYFNWCRVPDCFRIIGKYSDGTDMDVTMPAGIDAFIDKMEYYVPGSREVTRKFFDLLDEIGEAMSYMGYVDDPDVMYLVKNYPDVLRAGSYSTNKVFEALNLPQKVRDIIASYWSYLGVDLDKMMFIHFGVMIHTYIKEGAYIPQFTSHELSVGLSEKIREHGGEIWFNCRAEEILFDGDKVCGVKTTQGIVECDFVLANINPDIVYGKMVPKNIVPEHEKKLSTARKNKYGARMLTAYFGLDVTAEELGIKDYSIFLTGTADSVKEYNDILNGYDTNEYSIFLCYNVTNPDASPEGTCICSFTTFGSPKDWDNLKPEDYVKLKNKFVQKFIKNLKDKAGIDITGHIEEMSVASPWTFARYLGTPEGSVYGHEPSEWDGIIPRSMTLNEDYTVKGLYHIGAGGSRGDGYACTWECGRMFAKKAIKYLDERGDK